MPRLCVYIYIYIRLKGEEGKEESFQRFFHSISRYTRDTSLCAPGALGPSRMEEGGRGREENKYRATKGGENPSAHAGVPLLLLPFPPVCLTALAYGHECQCSSRKHDLGWNNPFGKGLRLSSFLYFLFFFTPLCLSLSAVWFPSSRAPLGPAATIPPVVFTCVATCTPRVCEIEFNLKRIPLGL